MLQLVQSRYNEDFGALISKASDVQASSVLREEELLGENIRVYYNSLAEFQTLAEHFGIFRDLKVRLSLANLHLQRRKQHLEFGFLSHHHLCHKPEYKPECNSQKMFKGWWFDVSPRPLVSLNYASELELLSIC